MIHRIIAALRQGRVPKRARLRPSADGTPLHLDQLNARLVAMPPRSSTYIITNETESP